ncbi:PREDICTED: uncharacterized protein LOC104769772 isoform X2 [Camelina sativa]|uniref:Uncharacterized protein LOC104769772 isoform X2 n=1 Tax=Camelina sativa TaxID=90675 RepID=A0ABM0XXE4_CAMSA|nr:PREDICTED: uncharacterized protein LOC104769772 isoform X2 [Camelina sativa]
MRDLSHLKTSLNNQWPPIGAPMNLRREEPWKSQFDDSVNAVSFGFVATAILISMFLVMAIFERLIRTTTTTTATTTNSDSSSSRVLPGMDPRVGFHNGSATKLGYQSPQKKKKKKKKKKTSLGFLILCTILSIEIDPTLHMLLHHQHLKMSHKLPLTHSHMHTL